MWIIVILEYGLKNYLEVLNNVHLEPKKNPVRLYFLYAHIQTGRILKIIVWSPRPSLTGFPYFSPTCFDILSWNFVCGFVFMNLRGLSGISFRKFL